MTLPRLTIEEAAERGYVHITTPVKIIAEAEIIDSMEKSMRGIDAVWINVPQHGVELGRKQGELKIGL